jgi:hypothetical protein
MSLRVWILLTTACLVCAASGCVSVKAPKEINIGSSSPPEKVDSSRVPDTRNHEEARDELRKAYRYVRYLEEEVEQLEDKAKKYKRERDRCEDRLERYED